MLLFAETPANPRLDLVDLDRLGAIAGPMKVVDSTFATPLGQRPLDHGVDLVVHSATKAIGGHNDVTLGVVAGSRELIDWIWGFAVLQGANASPFDAAGGLRGLRTLGVRLRHQSAAAAEIAEALEGDDRVTGVRHPGLASHPQHDLALRQMDLMGGLVTFDVAGGLDAGRQLVESTRICQLATSLGRPGDPGDPSGVDHARQPAARRARGRRHRSRDRPHVGRARGPRGRHRRPRPGPVPRRRPLR